MPSRKKWMTIGALGAFTGVHPKSLRYYDRIGILPPAYVDPESGYRYYSFPQARVVEAIQLCVGLDIPLRQFSQYLEEGGRQIHYRQLLRHGTELAAAKMAAIQEKLQDLEEIQQEMERAEACRSSGRPLPFHLTEKVCWVQPFSGDQSSSDFFAAVQQAAHAIRSQGLRSGYETGLLMMGRGQDWRRFLFLDVELAVGQSQAPHPPQVLRIPGGPYLCRAAEESGLQKAPEYFPELFAQDYEKIVIETELFTGDYDYAAPLLEVRCSMPG